MKEVNCVLDDIAAYHELEFIAQSNRASRKNSRLYKQYNNQMICKTRQYFSTIDIKEIMVGSDVNHKIFHFSKCSAAFICVRLC